jgi:predicted DNA-binding protein (MmcQ/YjbR family)
MTQDEFNEVCARFPAATHVVQWGAADVWKVGGKVFAIGGWGETGCFAIAFKVSELMYEVLREAEGCRPAPYLASRGMKWIQRHRTSGPDDEALQDLIGRSYRMILDSLPRRVRTELGLATA